MIGWLRQTGNKAIWAWVIAGMPLMLGCSDRSDSGLSAPSATLILSSTAFAPESLMPSKFTCDGENISPALKWNQPPIGTKSFALIMEDPDALGQTFTHWVLYDLPPDIRQLPEKVIPQPFLKEGGLQGKTSFGKYGYGGPCPPNGTHQYVFKLYALDQAIDLPPGTPQADLMKSIQNHILAEAKLTGKYARP
jgi:Raf kinase inhibitor-like YbhB/YbcL family protein